MRIHINIPIPINFTNDFEKFKLDNVFIDDKICLTFESNTIEGKKNSKKNEYKNIENKENSKS